MKDFVLVTLSENNMASFKKDMQGAFQLGYEKEYGKSQEMILPEKDIDNSLDAKGAKAYEAFIGNERVGGAIVNINSKTHHNHLDFLFVKTGCQSRGVGQEIWKAIEKLHQETVVWETVTPYFEKRNIHFYVNRCGFHIVEFYNEYNKDPNEQEYLNEQKDYPEDDGMFRFQKIMRS